MLLLFVLT